MGACLAHSNREFREPSVREMVALNASPYFRLSQSILARAEEASELTEKIQLLIVEGFFLESSFHLSADESKETVCGAAKGG